MSKINYVHIGHKDFVLSQLITQKEKLYYCVRVFRKNVPYYRILKKYIYMIWVKLLL